MFNMSMSDRRARESLSQALLIVGKCWNCWNAQLIGRFNSFNAFQAVGSAFIVSVDPDCSCSLLCTGLGPCVISVDL